MTRVARHCSVLTDQATGAVKGFGFVEFRTEQEGAYAIQMLNRAQYRGRTLTVNKATHSGGPGAVRGGAFQSSRTSAAGSP